MTDAQVMFPVLENFIYISLLILTGGVGLYFFMRDGSLERHDTVEKYMMAGREMHHVPVSMSLIASIFSGLLVVSFPFDVYDKGTQRMMVIVGYVLFVVLATHALIPLFYKMDIVSVHEYLERRFNRLVRRVVSVMYVVYGMFYLSATALAPSMALHNTGFTKWEVTTTVITIICATWTALGGMNALVWEGTFLIGVIYGGLIAVLVCAANVNGGLERVWESARKSNKTEFFNFDVRQTHGYTIWTETLGMTFIFFTALGVQQMHIQRMNVCKTLRSAKVAMYLSIPLFAGLIIVLSLIGLNLSARYEECAPEIKELNSILQILPKFVKEELSKEAGVLGLFIASVLAASVSTTSAGLMTVATVITVDIIRPYKPKMSDNNAVLLTRCFVIACGIILFVISYILSLKQISLQSLPTVGWNWYLWATPFFSIFVLGIFIPWVNWAGALSGLVTAILFPICVAVGAFQCVTQQYAGRCSTTEDEGHEAMFILYRLNPTWWALLNTLLCILVAVVVSAATGFNMLEDVDPSLYILPLSRRMRTQLLESRTATHGVHEPSQIEALVGSTTRATGLTRSCTYGTSYDLFTPSNQLIRSSDLLNPPAGPLPLYATRKARSY